MLVASAVARCVVVLASSLAAADVGATSVRCIYCFFFLCASSAAAFLAVAVQTVASIIITSFSISTGTVVVCDHRGVSVATAFVTTFAHLQFPSAVVRFSIFSLHTFTTAL